VIQDAAEALGASYKGRPAGSQGVMAAFSFNGNKILTTSGGGMLASNRNDWVAAARHLASQARDPAAHYEHTSIGYNYRLSNLLAALGRGQLSVLEERVRARRANFDFYGRTLGQRAGWSFMPEAHYGVATRWLTCALVDPASGVDRETLRLALERQDIEARPVWKPMHLQPVFAECPVYGGTFGRRCFETGICLPSGSNLTAAERERVVNVVADVYRNCGLS
jgi:pyridoxal phosphate-dependent aminotransferase EpsN